MFTCWKGNVYWAKQLSALGVITFSSTIFVLVFQNRPIRVLFLLDVQFWLDLWRLRVQNLFFLPKIITMIAWMLALERKMKENWWASLHNLMPLHQWKKNLRNLQGFSICENCSPYTILLRIKLIQGFKQ